MVHPASEGATGAPSPQVQMRIVRSDSGRCVFPVSEGRLKQDGRATFGQGLRGAATGVFLGAAVVAGVQPGGAAAQVAAVAEPRAALAAEAQAEQDPLQRPIPKPDAIPPTDVRCTPDKAHCISLKSYIEDVCRTIGAVAEAEALDRDFFARLVWRESLFDSAAVSPVGAQGIAQFMPGTAALRGLDDAFNPAEALAASAEYLAELTRKYGNLGLAAAAYNSGEERTDSFVAKDRALPAETRAYVYAITGFSGTRWRDDPPDEFDLTLEPGLAFEEACVQRAAKRSFREFRPHHSEEEDAPLRPWAVIVASHPDAGAVRREFKNLQRRYPGVLGKERPTITQNRMPRVPKQRYAAQVGRDSRDAANALCRQLRVAGASCMVLKN